MNLADLPAFGSDVDASNWPYILPEPPDDHRSYSSTEYSGTYSIYDGSRVEDVTPERIARVDRIFGESPDGDGSVDLAVLVELTDGSWAACMAGADTTGWGCQCDVQWKWASTRDEVISQGLDRAARAKLDVALESDAR
jgi:hypothetical protein